MSKFKDILAISDIIKFIKNNSTNFTSGQKNPNCFFPVWVGVCDRKMGLTVVDDD